MAYTDEDLLKITEAVRSSLVNSGTNTATVTEATDIGNVADIVTHNAQGKLTRISPNNFNKENISRLQGTSENSNAMKDPFKFVGSFNTSTIGDFRTWLDNLHGTSSGLDNRGFYRAILNDSVIEITSSPINYTTEEYIQVVRGRVSVASTTGLLTFSYEYNILERKYSATDGWSSWRVVASADKFEDLYAKAIKIGSFEVESLTDGIGVNFSNIDGTQSDSFEIPVATTERAGVMSADMLNAIAVNAELIENTVIHPAGNAGTNAKFDVSDYIAIPNSVIDLSASGWISGGALLVAFYDAAKIFISGYGNFGDTVNTFYSIVHFAIPEKARYIRYSSSRINDKTVVVWGNKKYNAKYDALLPLSVEWIDGEFVNRRGVISVNSTWCRSDYLDVSDFAGITIKAYNRGTVLACAFYDTDYKYISGIGDYGYSIMTAIHINVAVPADAKYMRVSTAVASKDDTVFLVYGMRDISTGADIKQLEDSVEVLHKSVSEIQEGLGNLSDKIVVFDEKRITESDKVVDSSIVNPLKCYSISANNFGTNNAYNYWYTLFKLPAHTRCVPFERKNTMSTNVALVVKVDSLDQFKLNGSYTRLVAGGDVDTSSYETDDAYQHKPIEFNEDTYIAVLSNSETDYTKFCYLEFWTATDTTLTDINDRVLELEGVSTEKTKPYEIVIPDKVYAVVGDTLQIFYDSIFNVQNLANYQVQVLSDKGKAYPRYFEYNPTSSDIGETTLTFNLCEVNDCTTGVTNILTTKEVNLITVPTLTNSTSANVLCVGDSTTAGGVWCKELARRFYANDGNPQGLGLTTINICGRKTGIVANKTYGWEGTGGWTWSTYVSSPVDAVRFTVKDVSSLEMGANYIASNGVIFEIVEINVTNGIGNIRCQYSWDTPNKNEIPASGTLTKRYSTQGGDDTITYTAFESEKFSPFYVNGEVDFIDYANKYCNGIIDVIVIHLGINSMFGLKTNLASHLTSIMNTAKIFIDRFHEQFPNSKVLLITPPKCSVIGGMAANYNATQTATEGIYNRQMFQYHKKYFELANQPEYKNWVTVVNTCGEFDTPYGYPYNEKGVDTRVSNITERIGTNGVHPNADGYNMIADSVYRTLSGIL